MKFILRETEVNKLCHSTKSLQVMLVAKRGYMVKPGNWRGVIQFYKSTKIFLSVLINPIGGPKLVCHYTLVLMSYLDIIHSDIYILHKILTYIFWQKQIFQLILAKTKQNLECNQCNTDFCWSLLYNKFCFLFVCPFLPVLSSQSLFKKQEPHNK